MCLPCAASGLPAVTLVCTNRLPHTGTTARPPPACWPPPAPSRPSPPACHAQATACTTVSIPAATSKRVATLRQARRRHAAVEDSTASALAATAATALRGEAVSSSAHAAGLHSLSRSSFGQHVHALRHHPQQGPQHAHGSPLCWPGQRLLLCWPVLPLAGCFASAGWLAVRAFGAGTASSVRPSVIPPGALMPSHPPPPPPRHLRWADRAAFSAAKPR
jgi:hypothetical protein